jgi:hypothetical protein
MKQINHSLEATLKQSEKRAFQHWYQDGLAETVVGGYALLLGLFFFGDLWLARPVISPFGLPLLIIGGVLMQRPILRRLKARISYSRTGYVNYQEPLQRRPWLALGLVFGLGLIVGVVFVQTDLPGFQMDSDQIIIWLTFLQGAIIALPTLYLASRFDLRRYYILAAVSVLLGMVAFYLELGHPLAPALYFTCMGAALILSGLLTLQHFLRHSRPYQEAT